MLELHDIYDALFHCRFDARMLLSLCYMKLILMLINYYVNTLGCIPHRLNSFRMFDLALLDNYYLSPTIVV